MQRYPYRKRTGKTVRVCLDGLNIIQYMARMVVIIYFMTTGITLFERNRTGIL